MATIHGGEPRRDELQGDEMTSTMPDLRRLAAEMKRVGARGLQREMNKGLRSATVFLEAAVRDAAARQLPQSGGLARSQSAQEIRIVVLAGGVRMQTVRPGSWQTDKGFVRHPVYGVWRAGQPNQPIPAATGWWTDTLNQRAPLAAPLIRAELEKALAKLKVAV